MRLYGAVGISNFTVLVRTNNSHYIYIANFQITVAGISVTFGTHTKSGLANDGISLGSFENWLKKRQIAVPLRLQPLSTRYNDFNVNSLKVSLRSLSGSKDLSLVDSLIFNDQCPALLRVAQTAGLNKLERNTYFLNGTKQYSIEAVQLSPSCGIAISSDAKWLFVRLEQYRVSQYGFSILIEWVEAAARNDRVIASLMPMKMFVRYVFDNKVRPPPLLRNISETLDYAGREVIRMRILNGLNPPQGAALTKQAFVLTIRGSNGRTQNLDAFRAVALNKDRIQELSFLTESWADFGAGDLKATLRYRANAVSKRKGDSHATHECCYKPVVAEKGTEVSLRVAAATAATTDDCETVQCSDGERFVVAKLQMERLNRVVLSEFKKRQLTDNMGVYFKRDKAEVRLIQRRGKDVTFAVMIAQQRTNDELERSRVALWEAIWSGVFARSVNLAEREVKIVEIRMVRGCPCDYLAEQSNKVEGKKSRRSTVAGLVAAPIAIAVVLVAVLLAANSWMGVETGVEERSLETIWEDELMGKIAEIAGDIAGRWEGKAASSTAGVEEWKMKRADVWVSYETEDELKVAMDWSSDRVEVEARNKEQEQKRRVRAVEWS